MDEQYFQDLFNWISSKDPSYSTKLNYEQFRQKMQSPEYAQKMDSWVNSVDPNYLNELKKKGQKSSLIPQVQPQAAQPTQVPYQTPEQQESATMASQLAATSSASQPQARPAPPTTQKPVVAQQPSASQFFDAGPMAGQQQQPVSESTAMPEYGAEMKMKAEETQQRIKEKFPEYLKPVLESITPDLMTRSEEYVVPELKYQLEPMGFKFDETVPGLNAVKITAPNGNSRRFELSAGTKLIAESISNDIKEFVQRNVANIPTSKLSSLESQYKAENRKFKSEKDISEANATIQNEAKSYINEFRNFENEARVLLSEEEKLNQSSDSERSSEEYARRALEAQRKRLELQTKEADLLKRRDSLIGKDKSLEIAVGKYVTTKEEQGTTLGAVGMSLGAGTGRFLAWAQSLVTDIGAAITPDFMVLGESQWKDAYIKEAQKRGIPLPPKDSYGSYPKAEYEKWLNSLDEDVKDELHDAIIDETQKEQKYTKLENGKSIQQTLRESVNEVLGPKSTTKEYVQDIKKGTVGNALLGAVESIPAFVAGGGGPRGAALRLVRLFAQSEDAQFEKMENNPNFDDISESEKRKISIPIAITTAVLEEIGFRNIIANKGMLNGITMRALGKAGSTTTARSFGELVKNEVNSMVAKGVLTLTGAALAEAETGALQQIAEYTVEDIYNVVKDKKDENGDYMKMFDTPDSISEYVSGVAMAGLQEAIGGFVLGVPSAVSAASSKKGFLNMDDDAFETFERIANDDNMMKSYVSSLKSKVSAGTLTMAQAKEQLNEYRNAVSVYNKLPEGLSIGQKKEAMNLIKERSDLETQIQGKDEALVKPQKDRINAINESLTKISEDAVQEQTAAEGLLRTRQSEMGLPQMGQGSEIATDEEKENLKAKRNVELFPEQTEFANQIGGSGSSSTLSDYSETNGIGVATYSNPTTGQVDVIMSGTTDNDYVGFVRVYENGKPTNRFTSKMSNESGNKGNFVTMISQAQAILPEGHEYTETTNISLDGLRVFSNQLNRGYEVVTDESGNPVTSTVTLNAASAQGLRGAQTQEQKEDLFTDAKVTTQEEFDAVNKQVTELMPQATATWNQANNTVSIQLPVLRSTKVAAQPTTETQAETTTQEAPKVEEKTPLQIAKENRRKAKALLNSLREGMGIDANAKAEALVKYHKSLVREALEFIKEKKGELGEWIRGFDSKNIPQLKKAWDEATGVISPVEKADQLGYSIKDVIGDDKWTKEIIEESGIEDMSGRRDIVYTYSDASIVKNSAGNWMLSIDNKFIGGYRTLQIAKQVAEYYDKNPSKIPKRDTAAEPNTDLEKATEERRKAKALLNSLRSGMGITPSAKMTALAKYHRALVNEAIQYIKQGGKTAKAFAKKIGTKYSIAIEKAWNEATGKITPIQNPEDLGYTYEDIYDDDMSAVEGYEEMMDEVEFKANEATKGKKYIQRDLKRARKTKKNLEKAKAQEEEYKADFDRLLKEAKDLVSNSAIYQEADDIQKDKLIRDVEAAFGIKQKTGPSPAELFGDVKSVNKLMEAIDFLFEDANKSKNYLAEVYQKARQRYLNYKNSEEYQRNSDKDVRLKNKVAKAKQEMDEYANKNTQEAINALTDSEIYKKASPEEQKRMLEYLKDKFSKSQKSKILPTQLFRDIVDVKMITMSEKALLVKQIKDMARGAKDAITAWKTTSRALAKQMDDLVKGNKISDKQMVSVLKKFSAVDMNNEESIEKFVEYMTKVFNDAEYANKIEGLAAKRKAAKKNILTKLGVAPDLIESVSRMLAINPYLIPDSVLDDYIYLLDMLGDRAAVLNLADKSFVQNKVNDVMNEVNNEIALADNLKLVFDGYADKVIVDGKVSFSKTIAKMLKENRISEAAAEFMTKYKSRIMPPTPKGLTSRGAYAKVRGFMKSGDSLAKAIKKVAQNEGVTEQEVRDMLDELGREKTALIRQIRSAPINGGQLAMKDERDLAAKLQELIKTDGINGLEISELEILAKIIGNINSGFISNSAQQISEKIQSVNDGKVMFDSVMRGKLPSISKAYAKLKKLFVGTTVAQIMVEKNPLFYIDQVIGDMNTRNVFNSLFKKISQAQSRYTAELHTISDILNQVQTRVAQSFNMDPMATRKSSYKMMAYMIEREFQSNPDSKTVHSAVDFLERTIKEIDKLESSYNENDSEMLQEVLDEINALKDANGVVDLNNFLSKFNKQEKAAINTFTNINNSMGDKALFTASVIRGSKINLINNYVHRDVLYSSIPGPGEIRPSTVSAAQNAMMPSTAAGTLEERTEAVSPINFNVFNSVMKGARNTLLDYHMTAPVRTARMALNNTEQRLDELTSVKKENRQIFNALKSSLEKALDDVLVKNFEESTLIDDVVQFISKNGYRAVLAGVSRFTGELTSNIAFAVLVDPQAMRTGSKYTSMMMSPDASLILNNLNSTVTQRVVPTESLSGKLIDTNLINKSVGIKDGKTRGTVANKIQQIYNLTAKKYVNAVELVSDTLISTPDKLIVRPLWFGSFANEFKELTGMDIDFDKVAQNDEAYMNQYKNELARAVDMADGTVVRAAASNNPFMGILKNANKSSTGMKGAMKAAFNNFNSFMTTFLIYEYITAKTGIYAAMGNGMVSRQKGVQMLAGVTTRMMVYQAITVSLGNTIASMLSGVDDDDEDQEESLFQNLGRLFASAMTSMMFGRDFGNATKTLVNYGIEEFNKEQLEFLREGEYDPMKDAIAYSILSPKKDGTPKEASEILMKMTGSFGPSVATSALVYKNMFGKEKKEEGAIQRQADERSIRIPLEIAGNAGLVPFYKDIHKAALKSIYSSIKEEKKAEEAKSNLLDKEWSEKKDKEVEALQKMLETETDLNKINIIRQKIGEAKMTRKQYKDMLETQKGERQYKAQLKESLLGGYEDMYELKRYDPELYEKNFGENSDYYKENKDEMEVEKEVNKTRKAIRDVEEGYVEPSKKKTYRYGPQDESDEGGSKSEYRYGPQDGSGKKGGKSEYKYGPQ